MYQQRDCAHIELVTHLDAASALKTEKGVPLLIQEAQMQIVVLNFLRFEVDPTPVPLLFCILVETCGLPG